MEKLIIKNGIIQNKTINGLPVRIDIVQSSGKRNVRTLIPMENTIGYTIHETGNTSPSATDTMHSKYFQNVEDADKSYVGAHIFIDRDSYTQVLPINEVAFHAGDGSGNGNRKTISFEICVNGNRPIAEYNTQYLVAMFLDWREGAIFKHQDWSGKECPKFILREGRWEEFKGRIIEMHNNAKQDVSDWAIEGYRYVVKNGISDGSRPKDLVTREELWTMLHRIKEVK